LNKKTLVITAVSQHLTSQTGLSRGALQRSVNSFSGFGAEILVVVPDVSRDAVVEHFKAHCPNATPAVVGVPLKSKGALVSATLGWAQAGREDGELWIAAGDTEFLSPTTIETMNELSDSGAEMGTVAFKSQDPRFSYLNLSRENKVLHVVEKRVVGNLATTGVFYFRSARDFLKAAEWCFVNNAQLGGSYYVSAALNFSVFMGGSVQWREIRPGDFKKHFSLNPEAKEAGPSND